MQIGNSVARKKRNTSSLGEPTQIEGKSRDNVHLGPNFPHDHKVIACHHKTFDPPPKRKRKNEFVKGTLVSNVRGFSQVRESPLPLNPTIILQGVPNNLICFLNGSLQSIKTQIIPLGVVRHVALANLQ